MNDIKEIDAAGFPKAEIWYNESIESPEESKDETKKPDSGYCEDNNHLYFKTYNNRRLSDSFSISSHNNCVSLNDKLIRKQLSEFLPLLLIQELTKSCVSKRITSSLQYGWNDQLSNILDSLLNALSTAIDTPLETQTLQYCETVLKEILPSAIDNMKITSYVVTYFLHSLSSKSSNKQAALALLSSYCSKRRFSMENVTLLLRGVIYLYNFDNLKILELCWRTVDVIIQNLRSADEMKLVSDVCLSVKCAFFYSKDRGRLSGLCYSEGFDSIFPLYEKVLLKGIIKDKRLAAQALRQLISYSSVNAIQPSLCSLASLLTCVIIKYKDEPCVHAKIAFVEALNTLLSKIGIHLKMYFSQIQCALLMTMKCDNRNLQLTCIKGLCSLVHFYAELDSLYDHLIEAVKNGAYTTKKIMLFALRCIVKSACVPLPGGSPRKILILLISMLNYQNDSCRIAAAGCIGTIFRFLSPQECEKVLRLYFLDDDPSLPWRLRHSKCTALMVGLKESPSKLLCQEEWSDKICENILSYMISKEVDIILSSIKACGYFMLFKFSVEVDVNPALLYLFCEAINHASEEVKYTFTLVVNCIAKKIILPLYAIKQIVPCLEQGTRDDCIRVKSSSKSALLAVLDLCSDDEIAQMYLDTLAPDVRELFEKTIINLKEFAKISKPKVEELDFTLNVV